MNAATASTEATGEFAAATESGSPLVTASLEAGSLLAAPSTLAAETLPAISAFSAARRRHNSDR